MSNLVNNQPYKGKIVIHPAIMEEVAMYSHAYDAIREYICNGWDADADKIDIKITKDSIRIEDWGTGITNFSRFWGVADQHKSEIEYTPKYKRRPIGRKGLGKLSFSMLGKKIFVETRTSNSAAFSTANFEQMDYDVFPRKNISEALSHTGTQITINDLKEELKEDDLIKYIKENLYGLISQIASKDHPIKIFVNGKKISLSLPNGIHGEIQTDFGYISCILMPSKTTKIDVLYRGVKVKEVNPAPSRPARGFFNVTWLVPTLDRSNFVDGKDKKTFFKSIHEWILKNIPSKNADSPKELEKSVKDVLKNYDQVMRDLGIMPENLMPTSKTLTPTDFMASGIAENRHLEQEPPEQENQETQQERKRHQHKILKGKEKPLKSAFGINVIFEPRGKDQPAVIPYRDEKLIVINTDNDLIKTINQLKSAQKFISFVFLFGRAHFHVLEKFVRVKEYEMYVDNMVSMVLLNQISDD